LNKFFSTLTLASTFAAGVLMGGCKDQEPEPNSEQPHNHVHHEGCDHDHSHAAPAPAANDDLPDDMYLEFEVVPGRYHRQKIDPALLHPETGEITVAFVASLSPISCSHHDLGGRKAHSTDADDIAKPIKHFVTVHRLPEEKIYEAYTKARTHWQADNVPATAQSEKTEPPQP